MERNASGKSLVVGVRKPAQMSSHDVVNRCRTIFGERRVGHTGTLDPMATGVLCVCIGPATRLDAYLVNHDKRYRVTIAFGMATDTDDGQGRPVCIEEVPLPLYDVQFASGFIAGLIGAHKQVPPAYSAIKVKGKKSYEAARAGQVLDLAPRDIEVYDAHLLGVREGEGHTPCKWDVVFHVSKGTYLRALARDIGAQLGCPAHVAALERIQLGNLLLEQCVDLKLLDKLKDRAALNPVRLLGIRCLYVYGSDADRVSNGACLPAASFDLYEQAGTMAGGGLCAGTDCVCRSYAAPHHEEMVAIISHNRLAALYTYNEKHAMYNARCVFQTGVSCGKDV